jgi:hypothetical protein
MGKTDFMTKKQKLELTWIGKENRPKLEPRILLEDPSKSHPRTQGGTDRQLLNSFCGQAEAEKLTQQLVVSLWRMD